MFQTYVSPKKYPTKIFGHSCDPKDKILNFTELPELKLGDWMMWKDMGDYTSSLANEFNGFHAPNTYVMLPHKYSNLLDIFTK